MDKPKNGTWRLIGTVTTIFIVLVGYVVANDRLRAKGDRENDSMRAIEDIRICDEMDKKVEKVENRVVKRLDDFQIEQTIQGKTLARIEAKL